MNPHPIARRGFLAGLVAGLDGLLGLGCRKAEAEVQPDPRAILNNLPMIRQAILAGLEAEVPAYGLLAADEEMPRYVDWRSGTAIFRCGRAEAFQHYLNPLHDNEPPKYALVDAATGRRFSDLIGHHIIWADTDLEIYARVDHEGRTHANLSEVVHLVHRPGIRFARREPDWTLAPLSRTDFVQVRHPVTREPEFVDGKPRITLGLVPPSGDSPREA